MSRLSRSRKIHAIADSNSVFVASVFAQDVRQQIQSISETTSVTLVGLGAVHENGLLVRAISALDARVGTKVRRRIDNFVVKEVAGPNLRPVLWARLRESLYRGAPSVFPPESRGDRMGLALDVAGSQSIAAETKLVFAREDAAENTFTKANRLGIATVYDLPTPHHATVRRLMENELEEFPHALATGNSEAEWAEERTARKTREARLAHRVLVASEMTRESICRVGVNADSVTRIPYGCSPLNEAELSTSPRKPVVLYVGNISLRKGIPRLLRVWKKLGVSKTHTLRLVGKMCLPRKFLSEYDGQFEHVPWVPRSELKRHYLEASFFVFPSVADGFGLVLNEAISHGLPVLASSNNGARGFMEHGRHAMVYQHGNDDEFAGRMDQMLSDLPGLAEMGKQAAELSRKWTWSCYREAVACLAEDTINSYGSTEAENV